MADVISRLGVCIRILADGIVFCFGIARYATARVGMVNASETAGRSGLGAVGDVVGAMRSIGWVDEAMRRVSNLCGDADQTAYVTP